MSDLDALNMKRAAKRLFRRVSWEATQVFHHCCLLCSTDRFWLWLSVRCRDSMRRALQTAASVSRLTEQCPYSLRDSLQAQLRGLTCTALSVCQVPVVVIAICCSSSSGKSNLLDVFTLRCGTEHKKNLRRLRVKGESCFCGVALQSPAEIVT